MKYVSWVVLSLELLILPFGVADAQIVKITSEVSCARCTIDFETVVTLRGLSYNFPPSLIARSPTGETYLFADAVIKAFGKDGQFRQQIGRRGGGPGEYEVVRNILVARDGSIHVLDAQLSRYSVFSPDGKVRRTATTLVNRGIGMDAVILPDGQLVVNGIFATAMDVGYALQRIDTAGHTTLRFDEGTFDLRQTWTQRRLLWARTNGELLAGKPYAFTIDVYSPDLTKHTTVKRVADWIPSQEHHGESPSSGVYDTPFTPELNAMWEDADGLVWLVMFVPSPRWKPGAPMRLGKLPPRDVYDSLANRPRSDAIVEVIDLKRGRVVARSRITSKFGQPFGGGYLLENMDDLGGEPAVRISRFRMKR